MHLDICGCPIYLNLYSLLGIKFNCPRLKITDHCNKLENKDKKVKKNINILMTLNVLKDTTYAISYHYSYHDCSLSLCLEAQEEVYMSDPFVSLSSLMILVRMTSFLFTLFM